MSRGRREDVLFSGQPLSLQYTGQRPEVLSLHIVPNTSSQSVTPTVEVVVHTPPVEVHPTGGTGLQPGIVLGLRFCVLPSSVGHPYDRALLPADAFGSPDLDMALSDDHMAPLEHHLASGPSSSPHPSLGMT